VEGGVMQLCLLIHSTANYICGVAAAAHRHEIYLPPQKLPDCLLPAGVCSPGCAVRGPRRAQPPLLAAIQPLRFTFKSRMDHHCM
jgi:hypothetical protein